MSGIDAAIETYARTQGCTRIDAALIIALLGDLGQWITEHEMDLVAIHNQVATREGVENEETD